MDVSWESKVLMDQCHESSPSWGVVKVMATCTLSGLVSVITKDFVVWE